jgi:hypothetical protein
MEGIGGQAVEAKTSGIGHGSREVGISTISRREEIENDLDWGIRQTSREVGRDTSPEGGRLRMIWTGASGKQAGKLEGTPLPKGED